MESGLRANVELLLRNRKQGRLLWGGGSTECLEKVQGRRTAEGGGGLRAEASPQTVKSVRVLPTARADEETCFQSSMRRRRRRRGGGAWSQVPLRRSRYAQDAHGFRPAENISASSPPAHYDNFDSTRSHSAWTSPIQHPPPTHTHTHTHSSQPGGTDGRRRKEGGKEGRSRRSAPSSGSMHSPHSPITRRQAGRGSVQLGDAQRGRAEWTRRRRRISPRWSTIPEWTHAQRRREEEVEEEAEEEEEETVAAKTAGCSSHAAGEDTHTHTHTHTHSHTHTHTHTHTCTHAHARKQPLPFGRGHAHPRGVINAAFTSFMGTRACSQESACVCVGAASCLTGI